MGLITPDDVRKVAKLARLDLEEAKITTYAHQIERIFDYVSHLESIDTEGVLPTTRAVEVVNVTRADGVDPTEVRICSTWHPSGKAISFVSPGFWPNETSRRG
jgi:aspartyl-tRNA(Asn)/glutamyl-tRNA(Gln) amidotransferase subunit C